jgi:hypothetical protein
MIMKKKRVFTIEEKMQILVKINMEAHSASIFNKTSYESLNPSNLDFALLLFHQQ